MIKQKFLSLTVFICLLAAFFNPRLSLADNSTSTSSYGVASSTEGSVLGLQAPSVPPIIAAISSAKTQLNGIKLNYQIDPIYKTVKNSGKAGSGSAGKKTGKTSKVISSYQLSYKDIALAVLDPATSNMVITVGRQTDKTMIFSDPAVDVKLIKFNGVNSKFQVNSPANGTVVALKYLISAKDSGSKGTIEKGLSEAIYVPYSDAFSQPGVLAYGAGYLNNIIKKVASDLANIPSTAAPGKTITQAIPPALIKALVYAEHTDTAKVLYGSNIQDTINQLNVIFALNGGDAYKYSVSTAGARGISQFIPSTYSSLVKRHPEAGLIDDFVIGMSDHENSIKATYLLLDDYAGAVRVKTGNSFTQSRIFDYGAASYNGGATRVARAVNAFGDNWNQDRSGDISSAQGQVNSLTAQVKSLKAKIKKASGKTKSSLQSQLNSLSAQLSEATNTLATLKSASLRNETVNYLLKVYKVIPLFNDEQLTLN